MTYTNRADHVAELQRIGDAIQKHLYTFNHEGERFQIERYGPVTCLCWNLADKTLWRFETEELMEILNGSD